VGSDLFVLGEPLVEELVRTVLVDAGLVLLLSNVVQSTATPLGSQQQERPSRGPALRIWPD